MTERMYSESEVRGLMRRVALKIYTGRLPKEVVEEAITVYSNELIGEYVPTPEATGEVYAFDQGDDPCQQD